MEEGIKQGIEKGIEKGIKDGKKEEKINIAKTLLKKGVNIDIILEATSLSKNDIKKLDLD